MALGLLLTSDTTICQNKIIYILLKGLGHRGRMLVRIATTCAISAYHHWSCEFEPSSWRGVLNTTLCYKSCQWLVTGWWFSPISSINKTDCHKITEILLKVALNTINPTIKRFRYGTCQDSTMRPKHSQLRVTSVKCE
jgi:hypothetical protein